RSSTSMLTFGGLILVGILRFVLPSDTYHGLDGSAHAGQKEEDREPWLGRKSSVDQGPHKVTHRQRNHHLDADGGRLCGRQPVGLRFFLQRADGALSRCKRRVNQLWRTASRVRSISSSVWANDTNAASNWEGAK